MTLSEIFRELTASDSENWVLVPDGRIIHGLALRQYVATSGRVRDIRPFRISRSELKKVVRALPIPNCLPLGYVMCADSAGADNLIEWLRYMSERKGFFVATIFGAGTAAQTLATLKKHFAHRVDARRDPSHQALH